MKIIKNSNEGVAVNNSATDNQGPQNVKVLNQVCTKIRKDPRRKLEISGMEVLVIASARKGQYYQIPTVQDFIEEVWEEGALDSLYLQLGVSLEEIVAKLLVAPLSVIQEVIADIQEAWRHRTDDFGEFLTSRSYKFFPVFDRDLEELDLCISTGSLADGSVVCDRSPSHVREEDVYLVHKALARIDPRGRRFIEEEVRFPEIVGYSDCVTTNPGDEIVLAQRPGRHGLTRFVKGRAPEPCDSVFLVLKNVRPKRYVLITGFVGRRPRPEPWDERAFGFSRNPAEARKLSRAFWAEHALVYKPDQIVPGTERALTA